MSLLPHRRALIDRSGTIASGGVSQQLCVSNANRRYLIIQNVSSGDLWVNFGVAAVINQPSFLIQANGSIVMESGVIDTQAVNIIGASNGQAFTAKEA